jgi:hypothetical protein
MLPPAGTWPLLSPAAIERSIASSTYFFAGDLGPVVRNAASGATRCTALKQPKAAKYIRIVGPPNFVDIHTPFASESCESHDPVSHGEDSVHPPIRRKHVSKT